MEMTVGMNIKNERVEKLARDLAAETGQSITGAIEQALAGELRRLRRNNDFEARKALIEEILTRSGPTAPGLSSDHADLYDEIGLPK
jgi:antitoxin VapB